MPTSAPGSSRLLQTARRSLLPHRRAAGFTLLELLVVVAIIAIASAGVAFAVRDTAGAPLDREAQRLAALLESGRARSRLSGQPVRWVAGEGGFRFDGLPREALPHEWLAPDTRVVGNPVLVLGPEPVIGPQEVVLTSAEHPEHTLRIATDGLRPFTVSAGTP
jgi:general secretion pathway protein H